MSTTATTKGASSSGTAPNKSKAKGWVGQHKVLVVLGVVAVVALWGLTRRSSGASSSDPTSSDPYGLASMPYGGTAADPYGGSGLTDPNSLAGLMEQLLAGQAGLGDTLNALAANPGEASTTTAKGGGGHKSSGHHKNGQNHKSHKSDGKGGHHKATKPHSHAPKPKVNGHPFKNPAKPKAPSKAQRNAHKHKATPSQPKRRK